VEELIICCDFHHSRYMTSQSWHFVILIIGQWCYTIEEKLGYWLLPSLLRFFLRRIWFNEYVCLPLFESLTFVMARISGFMLYFCYIGVSRFSVFCYLGLIFISYSFLTGGCCLHYDTYGA
jgi:hypothetical protein